MSEWVLILLAAQYERSVRAEATALEAVRQELRTTLKVEMAPLERRQREQSATQEQLGQLHVLQNLWRLLHLGLDAEAEREHCNAVVALRRKSQFLEELTP